MSETDARLNLYFEQARFGEITEPTTIIDKHCRIMAWALPGVIHPMRLVSLLWNVLFAICSFFIRRIITMQRHR